MDIKRIFSYIISLREKFGDTRLIYIYLLGFIFLFILIILPSSFAGLQPIGSVETFSKQLDYKNNDPGAWKVTQSAKWVQKDKARITINLESVLKKVSKNCDLFLVLDVSSSMGNVKWDDVKTNMDTAISKLLEIENVRVGLITFGEKSEIAVPLTDDKSTLINKINSITPTGPLSYYSALNSIDSVLENYDSSVGNNCTFTILTGSIPSKDTPNEIGFYNYLKDKYPFLTVRAIQYELGTAILDSVKSISDNQFVADKNNLSSVLVESSVLAEGYESFEIKSKIDNNYFSVDSVMVEQGDYRLNSDQEIVWSLDNFRSGGSAKMIIDATAKEIEGDLFITNTKIEIHSLLSDVSEFSDETQSPILKNNYKVIYDANLPDGCTITDTFDTVNKFVFDTVDVSSIIPKCDGYQFRGWKLKTQSVEILNDDCFIMPEEDVILRAAWSKLEVKKSVNGKIHQYIPPVLQNVSNSYSKEIWAYKNSITKVVFQDEFKDIAGAIGEWDISKDKNSGVKGIVVPNSDNSTYTAYIQGDGVILANPDSRYLFSGFSKLASIEGLQNFNTTNVYSMLEMFANCSTIVTLNLSTFDTSNVTDMTSMFANCLSLASINLSSFVTSKVTSMANMFGTCKNISSINLSSFNTSKVTNMQSMFGECDSLLNLDISNFNTSNVTNMHSMFGGCDNLRNLNLGYFDTSKVTGTQSMFGVCPYLITTITIRSNSVVSYLDMFRWTAYQAGSRVVVNYTSSTSALVDKMIATKVNNSNVVKGSLVQ